MPRYDFVCPVCGVHFEKNLSFQQDMHAVVCPAGHVGARKQFSVPTVVYKGSGFYVTDHRSRPSAETNQ